MRKHRRMTALILALAMLIGIAGTAAAQDDQEAYWYESGRGYLYDNWYYGRGTTLTDAERSAFFRQIGILGMAHCRGRYGSFYIYQDGSFTGHAGFYDENGVYCSSDFIGSFNNVIRMTPYVYILETEDYEMDSYDLPEAIQDTMILTIPGIQAGMEGALKYEIQRIADSFGLKRDDPLPCYFITAFDSGELWFSNPVTGSTGTVNTGSAGFMPSPTEEPAIYALAIKKLATRTGPGTQYEEGGTYSVKDEYIRILSRAYDKRNGIWWVKCEIPYKKQIRVLWTGWNRFDENSANLEEIPIDPEY